ncbi:MAG: glycosyltransferase [Phycisphaerales bacterium]|nr:MAG: glycosyltransferase [Phycisphaerales bacterium]
MPMADEQAMASRCRTTGDQAALFDPQALATATVPLDLALTGGRIIYLWQPPTRFTLDRLRRSLPGVPILSGRFHAETQIRHAGLPYWSAQDFFPSRTLIAFDLAEVTARSGWTEYPEPSYLGMPLIDGDLCRTGVWTELVASAAMLMVIRRIAPDVEVLSDWMGCQLADAVGLTTRRLWRADLGDRNWPPRRWLRERMAGFRGNGRRAFASCATPGVAPSASMEPVEVAFLIGAWVEPRLLASFPVGQLAAAGYRCALWVHRRPPALEALIARTNVRCVEIDLPEPADDVGALQRSVGRWCVQAADAGGFAPLRGRLARRAVELVRWPMWTPKLVAMHRLMSAMLQRDRPEVLIAPAEREWTAYCGHHAARRLGIPSVGVKHGIWVPGSVMERLDLKYHFPLTADHVLAYTPQDERVWQRRLPQADQGRVVWRGNPRLQGVPAGATLAPRARPFRILIAVRGVGPGVALVSGRDVLTRNARLTEVFHSRLGDRIRVRLHPWDSVENYPARLRSLILPCEEDLGEHLADHAAVASTYSNVILDAAATGRPVFVWDYDRMGLARCEVAIEGAAVVSADLDELARSAERFLDDAAYRDELLARAARFPEYLRRRTPRGAGSETAALVPWLGSVIERRRRCPGERRIPVQRAAVLCR